MKTFDYINNQVVGFIRSTGDNESIDVLGYCDNNGFNQLTESEALNLFPKRGKVYCGSFFHDGNFEGKMVAFYVLPMSTFFGQEKSKYMLDKTRKVVTYKKIDNNPIEGFFTNDGQHNFNVLERNNLTNEHRIKLVYSKGKIYEIFLRDSRQIIKYWKASSLNAIMYKDGIYITNQSLTKHDGVIDVMTNRHLCECFLTEVIKKNWENITKRQSFSASKSSLRELLVSLKDLDESIIENRCNRLKIMSNKLSLTLETMKGVTETTPRLGDDDKKANERVLALEQIKKEHDTEKNRIKKKFETELLRQEVKYKQEVEELRGELELVKKLSAQERTIEEKLQEKNLEIELLDETIKEKEQIVATLEESIAKINERKASIIEDFSIIRDVLNVADRSDIQTVKGFIKRFSLEEINFSDNPISRFQAYVKSLENVLKLNCELQNISPTAMGKILVKYNVLLCPSVSFAQVFIFASHKCKYLTEYVSAKWGSFDDLWKNGLEHIVLKSIEEPNTMHFLLLQNINISYLPNFLQPMVDMQKGVITKFPASDIAFPKNLRILCTIAEDELIKMPASVLRHFGCIDKSFQFEPSEGMLFADDAHLGYLTPEELNREREREIKIENMFEQYIDE